MGSILPVLRKPFLYEIPILLQDSRRIIILFPSMCFAFNRDRSYSKNRSASERIREHDSRARCVPPKPSLTSTFRGAKVTGRALSIPRTRWKRETNLIRRLVSSRTETLESRCVSRKDPRFQIYRQFLLRLVNICKDHDNG